MHGTRLPSLKEAEDQDRPCRRGARMLTEVLLPDAFAEEVLVEDVYVGEEVLHIFRLDLVRRFRQLLEEVGFGLRLRLRVRLQRWVHLVEPLQLLECYCGLDVLL